MTLSSVFLELGQDRLSEAVKGISIGKLRTFQLYERFRIRTHLPKVNTELLRKSVPRFWKRLEEHDEEFATDLSQAILISRMDMISKILDSLGIANEEGFFQKDIDAKAQLTDGWQAKVWEQFKADYPEAVLLFYINHLGWEVAGQEQAFLPVAA
jgi:hypothetical protein